jgi:hypothetical protein
MNYDNLLISLPAPNAAHKGPAFAGASAVDWCGAYSWDHGASVCKLQKNGNDGPSEDATGNSDSTCSKINDANSKDFRDAQEAVRAAYKTYNDGSTKHTSMQGVADTQAALEKAWLSAWYKQQYWAAIVTELDVTTVGSKAIAY